MRSVRVDPAANVAYVGGGATWADVDHETQAHGLATTGGLVSSTGVGGFTLGGGVGWLMRKHGLACDNLVGADVVTADGQLVRASESENPELLWGLRGGGGNFGVATQLELELHPVGPLVHAGPVFYPAEAAGDLLRLFRDWSSSAPDDVTAVVNLTSAPPLPVIPEEWHGKKVAAFIAVSTDPVEEADARVKPFREVAEPIADLLGPMPYQVMQSLLDPLWPKGIHAYFKGTNLTAPRRLADRGARRAASRCARPAGRDPRAPDGRRGRAQRGRLVVPGPLDAVPDQRGDRLARPGGRRRAHRVGAQRRRSRRRVIDGPRLRELPVRPGRRQVRLRPGDLRAPCGAQARVRPHERVPTEPEHRAVAGAGEVSDTAFSLRADRPLDRVRHPPYAL